MSATDPAEAIRSRQTSSREVVEASPSQRSVAETIRCMRITMAVNTLWLPAVALPVGIGDGLLYAVQAIDPLPRGPLSRCRRGAGGPVGIITPIDPRWR
jgi:amidase